MQSGRGRGRGTCAPRIHGLVAVPVVEPLFDVRGQGGDAAAVQEIENRFLPQPLENRDPALALFRHAAHRVRVVLSTATPVFDVAAPEPHPWYLTLLEDYMPKRSQAMPAPGVMAAEAIDVAEAEWTPPESPQPVETGISLQYAIPGRVSLKSGEAAKKLQLAQFEVPAEFSYYTFPKAGERAYLKGRLVNSSRFVLLPGGGNTYVGEEFTGGTFVPAVAQEESLEMSFGADERVRVKRELVRSFKSRGGVLGRTERQQFVYRTTVENFRQTAIAVEVVEQVPVSREKEIKVTVTKLEPKPETQDDYRGTRTWKPELKPGGKFTIELEFQVEYPAGRRVSGLF
uniref:Mucoidy inhibitor MuiA family protein n=1 Tax=candidate division WOR-3 bacterium TaxID=2052148 RepID=A0A7C4CB49_UNCW3